MILPSQYYSNAVRVLSLLDIHYAFLVVVAGALATHLVYKKYEVQPSSYLPTFLLLVVTPFICSSSLLTHFASPAIAYVSGFGTFYVSLLTSIACYRLSPWHPLAKYPGPTLAKLSKFWSVYIVLRGEQLRYVSAMHKKYGRFVRLGPNELSIADIDLAPSLLSPDMPKGPMWSGRVNPDGPASLIATRFSDDHTRKRVAWTHAFSSASVKDYQPAIARRSIQLADELEKRSLAGETVDLGTWMTYFAFDFMGDMAFGGGFELMRDGDVNGVWTLMVARIDAMGWQMHIPWATRLLLKFPIVTKAIVEFRKFTNHCAAQRKVKGSNVKDLFYHIINEGHEDPDAPAFDLSEVVLNGEVAIIGGSDTTSTTLSGVFFYLMTNPKCYARLREEVDAYFPPGEGEPLDGTRLAEMKYLNAVLNETMRVQPAVPTKLHRSREQGIGGKWVGEHYFSEGTGISVPPYVIHRDPRYFSPAPDAFWPERWLRNTSSTPSEKAQITHNMNAYIPFSLGNRNCAGKNLALAEMRVVTALLMQRFDMSLAPGYDPRRWEKELSDVLVMKPGEMPVVIKLRT